jgi:hypothetical protein
MTRGTLVGLLGALILATAGCGGGTPEPEGPVDEYGVAREDALDEDYDEVDQPEVKDTDEGEGEGEEEGGGKKTPAEPEFTAGMSVNAAINAVPPGTDRVNIEDDILSRPLMDPEVYKPCKPGGKHFKIKVAIWDGRAVGIDIDAKDQKLAACIRTQVEGLKWREKAKSLNTVEYAF